MHRITSFARMGMLALIVLAFSMPIHAQTTLPEGQDAQVIGIIDGDTIKVRIAGAAMTVRYIGVDAPELRGTTQKRCFAREATQANQKLVAKQTVRLEKDVSERDRFGRLLRYVYLTDGQLVNEVLAREGFATSSAFPPDVRYQERLIAAADVARDGNLGLWSKCVIAAPPAVAAPAVAAQTAPAVATSPGRWPNSVQPASKDDCPVSHPIKGNIGKKDLIYHTPASRYYEVTDPEGCFSSESDAVAAGFRAPK